MLSAYATTASLSSYAQLAALSAYVPLSTLSQYQRTLTPTAPLALSGTDVLSLDTSGLITATPATNGNVQLVSNNQIRCLNSGSYVTIAEISGVVSIGTYGLQPSLTVTAPLTLTGTPAKTLGLDTSAFITAMPVPPLWNMFQIVQNGVVGLLQAGPRYLSKPRRPNRQLTT